MRRTPVCRERLAVSSDSLRLGKALTPGWKPRRLLLVRDGRGRAVQAGPRRRPATRRPAAALHMDNTVKL